MNWLVLRIKVKVKMEGKKLVSAAVDSYDFCLGAIRLLFTL